MMVTHQFYVPVSDSSVDLYLARLSKKQRSRFIVTSIKEHIRREKKAKTKDTGMDEFEIWKQNHSELIEEEQMDNREMMLAWIAGIEEEET